MNQKSINYLMRFVLHGHHYTYRDCQMIESLAQLYGTDTDAYNQAGADIHATNGSAYVNY